MRIAIIHYWLVTMRGGEKVLESLCRVFPEADIYTHVLDPERISPRIRAHSIRTTFINRLPLARRHYQKYLPLMPFALEQLDLRGYDLVISSEAGPAKGVLTDSACAHICYCHSPMRYIWDFYQEYLARRGVFSRQVFRLVAHRLRLWDVASAARVDHFIANSRNVANRIRKHYRRESTVIHPPVDMNLFSLGPGEPAPSSQAPYILVGQLVGYKSAALAVEAFTRSGRELVIVGEGEERQALESKAGPSVHFLGRREDSELATLLRNAKALIFPGEEDFGIVPVEAMASGTPVIAFGKGGALETVNEGISGLFFHESSVESLNDALENFERREKDFSRKRIAESVRFFSTERFEKAFKDYTERVLAEKTDTGKGAWQSSSSPV